MIEKIGEDHTFEQFIPITDRLCYVANMSWEYGYVKALEEALEIQPSERTEYIRVIVLELQRIASHLVWLAAYTSDLGVMTMLLYPYRDREFILDILEHLTGARMMYNYIRPGGLRNDLYEGFEKDVEKFLDYFEGRLEEYYDFLDRSEVFIMRSKNVGVLPKDLAINLGATGPVLRGSGIKADVRKLEPYSVYSDFDFDIPVETGGDCLARYRIRFEEMKQSMRIIRQALAKLPENGSVEPVKRLRPKKDVTIYSRTEDPRGEQGFYLVIQKNAKSAYRVKIKSPAYSNLSLFPYLIRGGKLADIPPIVASVDLCMGEVDR